jgi:hypothetical protein
MNLRQALRTCAALLALSGSLVTAQEKPTTSAKPPVGRSVDEVARERRDLARRSLRILDETLARAAPLGNLGDSYYFWSLRLVQCDVFLNLPLDRPRTMDVEVYLATLPPVEGDVVLDSLRMHYRRMLDLDDRYHKLEERGLLSPLGYQHILDHRVEAELWLLREEQRRRQAHKDTTTP